MRVPYRNIGTWKALLSEFERTFRPGNNWIFRGQADAKCGLKTTLERIREDYGIPRRDLVDIEPGLIRKFKRQYYHYSADAPAPTDYPEWLAIMRHYGAPTRLLDWTYSFFAGVFFAIENSTTQAALWALNTTVLERELKTRFADIYDKLECSRNVQVIEQFTDTLARRPPVAFVSTLRSYRLNQRLAVQQGLFLCPGDLTKSFEDNLAAVIGNTPPASVLVKLRISADRTFRKDLLRRLHRMNMNNATLFPGLDGFARSLKQFLAFPKEFLPPDREYHTVISRGKTVRHER